MVKGQILRSDNWNSLIDQPHIWNFGVANSSMLHLLNVGKHKIVNITIQIHFLIYQNQMLDI